MQSPNNAFTQSTVQSNHIDNEAELLSLMCILYYHSTPTLLIFRH